LYRNYRSHPLLLDMSSKLLYGGMLEAAAEKPEVDPYGRLVPAEQDDLRDGSGNKRFPLLFYGVDGQHSHELDSPSFSNVREAEQVCIICQELLMNQERRAVPLQAAEIVVVAAFRAQVMLVRRTLRAIGLTSVLVGEAEDFQVWTETDTEIGSHPSPSD